MAWKSHFLLVGKASKLSWKSQFPTWDQKKKNWKSHFASNSKRSLEVTTAFFIKWPGSHILEVTTKNPKNPNFPFSEAHNFGLGGRGGAWRTNYENIA